VRRAQDDRGRLTGTGVVVEARPRGLYLVALDEGRTVVAHAAREADRNFVRLLAGDRVLVELAERDRTRGRITRRLGAPAGR
jgi:translation initiation factor IF-1